MNMQNLNWVDYVVLAIFFFSILAGLARGFVKEVISLITLVAAFVVAVMFTSQLAAAFTNSQTVQDVVSQTTAAVGASTAQPVSYAALGLSFGFLFAATVIVGSIIGSIINLAFQAGVLGIGNRLMGAVFGLCRGFIINLVLIFLVQLTSFSTDSFWTDSKMVTAFQPSVLMVAKVVSPSLENLKDKVGETLKKTVDTATDKLTTQ